MTKNQDRSEQYVRQVADEIMEQVKAGVAPWQKPWKPGEKCIPENLATGKSYTGGNSLYLMSRGIRQGHGDNRWGTYKQIEAAGGHVRKGERGTKVLFYTDRARTYPNLLLAVMPAYANHIWAADFTEFVQHGKKVYVATVLDLYPRRILGIQVAVRKGAALTIQALSNALLHHPRPGLFHSDNGREYDAMAFTEILDGCGIVISRSRPGCPWENGYQESFYDKFKVDLGDPNRFKTLGELVAEIYRTLWDYNNTRIHSALNMPPVVFAKRYALVA